MHKSPFNPLAIVVFTVLFCLPTVSLAMYDENTQIYKTVHSDGSVTYSDQPSSEAQEVVLNAPVSTFQSAVPKAKQQALAPQQQTVNYALTILSPAPDASIRSNSGEISIGAALKPRAGGFYQLHINNQIHESATGMFTLGEMERGAYKYSVKFINNAGKVIASSESRNVFLHQASALIN